MNNMMALSWWPFVICITNKTRELSFLFEEEKIDSHHVLFNLLMTKSVHCFSGKNVVHHSSSHSLKMFYLILFLSSTVFLVFLVLYFVLFLCWITRTTRKHLHPNQDQLLLLWWQRTFWKERSQEINLEFLKRYSYPDLHEGILLTLLCLHASLLACMQVELS